MYSKYKYLSAQIDPAAIIHNCGIIRGLIPGGCRLCPAVKCNAYGHGIEIVLPAVRSAEAEMLCISAVFEAEQLLELGWDRPILLLGSEFSIYSGKEKHELARWIVENQIRVTVTNKNDTESLRRAAESVKRPAVVHIKLDSGMSRMGLSEQNLLELITELRNDKNFFIEGLYTHLATADETDKSFAEYQLQRFNKLIKQLKKTSLQIPIIHAANSGAIIDLPESSFDMVRPGISIYGCHPSPQMRNKPDLKPAMKVVSFLTFVKNIPAGSHIGYGCTHKASKDMLIGVVPIGYGDGYDRRLSNIGKMTIAGQLVPVVGRVSMDQTVVDLTEIGSKGIKVSAGQEVIVIDNVRSAPNSIESIAEMLGTVPNEIMTRLGPRIQRVQSNPPNEPATRKAGKRRINL